MEFSAGFFSQGFVPANNTISSASHATEAWFGGTAAMVWSGAFQRYFVAGFVRSGIR